MSCNVADVEPLEGRAVGGAQCMGMQHEAKPHGVHALLPHRVPPTPWLVLGHAWDVRAVAADAQVSEVACGHVVEEVRGLHRLALTFSACPAVERENKVALQLRGRPRPHVVLAKIAYLALEICTNREFPAFLHAVVAAGATIFVQNLSLRRRRRDTGGFIRREYTS